MSFVEYLLKLGLGEIFTEVSKNGLRKDLIFMYQTYRDGHTITICMYNGADSSETR